MASGDYSGIMFSATDLLKMSHHHPTVYEIIKDPFLESALFITQAQWPVG